jgi:DNA repair protein RadC
MTYLIKDLPELEKPREKLKKYGVKFLTDEDLIAIVLRCGTKNVSVKDLAIAIKKQYNDLNNVSLKELEKINGMGEVKAITLLAAIELGKRCTYENFDKQIKFNKADIIYDYFKNKLNYLKQENLIAVFLDNKNKLINYKTIFIGTINMSITHPREIFKEAIKNSAVYIILIHNHPSGDPTPSVADMKFTRQIVETGKIVGIPLLDHIIIGSHNYYSFYDNGELDEKNITK